MTNRNITVTHNGHDYAGSIMQIESTAITMEDHGIVSAWLHCKGEGTGVGVGGICLDTPIKDDEGRFLRREGTAYGMDQIMRLMETVGVSTWEKLKGEHVIVLFEGRSAWGSQALGIASLTDDRVLILKEHANEWLARDTAEVPA